MGARVKVWAVLLVDAGGNVFAETYITGTTASAARKNLLREDSYYRGCVAKGAHIMVVESS